MTENAFILNFLRLYNTLGRLALPLLKKNRRLALEFEKRINTGHLEPAPVWIQAASAGEAYLALALIRGFRFQTPTRVLVTTFTAQGRQILEQGLTEDPPAPETRVVLDWFVFDLPDLMKNAVRAVNPKVMVLLETELWPGLLYHLKKNRTRIIIANARLSVRSARHYRGTRCLWHALSPDRILAVSGPDRERYGTLFRNARLETMPNIKFETLAGQAGALAGPLGCPVPELKSPAHTLAILASIRRQEEPLAVQLVQRLLGTCPSTVMAVFPRHMHRIRHWRRKLKKAGINVVLRSEIRELPGPGTVVLWDVFGQLKAAYGMARAVFVGASLKPLGGQNFLEPAAAGAVTVIGPHFDDFAWVSEDIFSRKIVIRARDKEAVAQAIQAAVRRPFNRAERIREFNAYVGRRCGGASQVCQAIMEEMAHAGPGSPA